MTSKSPSLPLPVARALKKLGRDMAVARKKRRISSAEMAERLFVSRDTLWRLENGDPTVAVGTLATALFVLQLHDRLLRLAEAGGDVLGLEQEAEKLPKRIRRPQAAAKS
jgi:transcriptional regulator with XRE-family HTH domain